MACVIVVLAILGIILFLSLHRGGPLAYYPGDTPQHTRDVVARLRRNSLDEWRPAQFAAPYYTYELMTGTGSRVFLYHLGSDSPPWCGLTVQLPNGTEERLRGGEIEYLYQDVERAKRGEVTAMRSAEEARQRAAKAKHDKDFLDSI